MPFNIVIKERAFLKRDLSNGLEKKEITMSNACPDYMIQEKRNLRLNQDVIIIIIEIIIITITTLQNY